MAFQFCTRIAGRVGCTPMAEKMERWLVQLIVPEGTYEGAVEMIAELTDLIELNSEIQVVSAEIDPEQPEGQ